MKNYVRQFLVYLEDLIIQFFEWLKDKLTIKEGDRVLLTYRHYGYPEMLQKGTVKTVNGDYIYVEWDQGSSSSEWRGRLIKLFF